jgi:hypothetical protein
MSLTIRTLVSSASVVIGLAMAPWPVQAQDHHIVMPPDQVKFGPAPPALPAGAKIAVLQGDPSAAGPVVLRLAFPANFVMPPHWHSNAERLTIISGTRTSEQAIPSIVRERRAGGGRIRVLAAEDAPLCVDEGRSRRADQPGWPV